MSNIPPPRPLFSVYYSRQPSVQRIRELSVQQLAAIRESFKIFDAGNKGYLCRDDLKCALISLLGIKPTKVNCLESGFSFDRWSWKRFCLLHHLRIKRIRVIVHFKMELTK